MDLRRFAIGRPRFGRRLLARLLLCAVSLYAALFAVRVVARKYYVFLPGYVRWRLAVFARPTPAPPPVPFFFAAQFEPTAGGGRTRHTPPPPAGPAPGARHAESRESRT